MKRFYFIILWVSFTLNIVFAQRIAMHTLTNFDVNTSTNKLSFDIYSQSIGPTSLVWVGVTTYYINFNNVALNNPVLSNINPKYTLGSPSGDYDEMTIGLSLIPPQKIVVTIKYNGNFGLGAALETAGPIGERMCTVTLNISNQSLTGAVNWDELNSAMQTSNLQFLDNQFQGSFDQALPIELSSFTGKLVSGNKVDLNWVTKTEVSNYGFNIERRINDGEWNTIGFVEGNGNSNSPKKYNFTDTDLIAGGSKFQYRLKQIDSDGKVWCECGKAVGIDKGTFIKMNRNAFTYSGTKIDI